MSEIRSYCTSDLCKNKSPSLTTNELKGLYYCFRCGARGKLESIISTSTLREGLLDSAKTSGVETPPPFRALTTKDREYLTQTRGIPRWVVDVTPTFSTDTGILFFFPGNQRFWQERRHKPFKPPWKMCESYLGPKEGLVYNVNTFDPDRGVAVVEGVGDALKVAGVVSAAATLGKTIHPPQARVLAKRYDFAFYVPDADVPLNESQKNYETLCLYFPGKTCWVFIEEGDPGDAELDDLKKKFAPFWNKSEGWDNG